MLECKIIEWIMIVTIEIVGPALPYRQCGPYLHCPTGSVGEDCLTLSDPHGNVGTVILRWDGNTILSYLQLPQVYYMISGNTF